MVYVFALPHLVVYQIRAAIQSNDQRPFALFGTVLVDLIMVDKLVDVVLSRQGLM